MSISMLQFQEMLARTQRNKARQHLDNDNNLSTHHPGATAKLESNPGHEPLAAHQAQATESARVHVRFTSVRKRLLDPDNVAVKWTLDCLRFAKIICGDEAEKITLEVRQQKVKPGQKEVTLVELFIP